MSDLTLEYFEEYRKKIAEKNKLSTRETLLTAEIYTLQQQRKALMEDIDNMQRLITTMIENGWDPVEAKLKTEQSERQRSFWYHHETGAQGATGAIGCNRYVYPNGIALSGAGIGSAYDPYARGVSIASGAVGATGSSGHAAGANGATGYYIDDDIKNYVDRWADRSSNEI